MNEFLNHWFKGFEKGLIDLPENERCKLLAECGKACSESYSLNVYRDIREKTTDLADFFERLKSEIPAISIYELEKGKRYEIRYQKCLCDLYTKGYINKGMLCECSRKSLLYNLESVFPEHFFQVELVDSILNGGRECILHVMVHVRIKIEKGTTDRAYREGGANEPDHSC